MVSTNNEYRQLTNLEINILKNNRNTSDNWENITVKNGYCQAKTKKLKMKACAITDHGVMYGVVPFYLECLEQKIKPIIGC